MTTEQILVKIKEYFAQELKSTNRAIENKWDWFMADKDKYIVQTAHSCLGIVMFAQTLGVAYEDVAPLYDEYREKFKELLDNKYLLP